MSVRVARREDLPAVVALLAGEDAVLEPAEVTATDGQLAAFEAIDADPRHELLVLDRDAEVVGCMQVSYIPGLGRGGGERAHLEAIRIRADLRGRGLGGTLLREAIERARSRGCTLVQLTSNKRRTDAHRFYGSLGFAASHDGFKLDLTS